MKKVSFYVTGNVQDVMFRQTFIRGAQKRKLKGGASNDSDDHLRVHCSLAGDESVIDEMIKQLQETKQLNSWGASVEELFFYDHFIALQEHQVTTDNVDQYHWSPNVVFYI